MGLKKATKKAEKADKKEAHKAAKKDGAETEIKETKGEKPAPQAPIKEWSLDKPEGLEAHLSKCAYLSGGDSPGKVDAEVLEAMEAKKLTLNKEDHPHFFAWWWGLCGFSPAARDLWK